MLGCKTPDWSRLPVWGRGGGALCQAVGFSSSWVLAIAYATSNYCCNRIKPLSVQLLKRGNRALSVRFNFTQTCLFYTIVLNNPFWAPYLIFLLCQTIIGCCCRLKMILPLLRIAKEKSLCSSLIHMETPGSAHTHPFLFFFPFSFYSAFA